MTEVQIQISPELQRAFTGIVLGAQNLAERASPLLRLLAGLAHALPRAEGGKLIGPARRSKTRIDLQTLSRRITVNGTAIRLTEQETTLLACLFQGVQRGVQSTSNGEISKVLWDTDRPTKGRIAPIVSRINAKVFRVLRFKMIVNYRMKGYSITIDSSLITIDGFDHSHRMS